jgi:hypothetical protein
MATATKKKLPTPNPSPSRTEHVPTRSLVDRLVHGIDAIYRFLASVKLAVITLGTLVVTLAYATVFDSEHGSGAAAEYIYRSPGFAILLAFLGINILCAALIRYPWKKRQTGFVITHVGLLIMLAGSYYSVRTSDEGQVGMLEGDVKGELVRTNSPMIRVWEVDPHTKQYLREVDLPFAPGAFPWGPGKPQPRSVGERLFSLVTLGLAGGTAKTEEVLTQPGDAFRLVVKEHLPASASAREHVADPAGAPMARIRLLVKPPGMPEEKDAFPSADEQWFATEKKFYRVARAPMRGAPALVTFSAVDRPELVEDFLKPPTTDNSGLARFRYPDRSGHTRVFDWTLEGQQGKSVSLPESDLSVTLTEIIQMPTQESGLARVLGDDPLAIAVFKITRGSGEPVSHMALANLPMVPNTMPSQDPTTPPKPALASIHYLVTPVVDSKTNGRFGQIDVLAGPDHALSYRVFGRGKDGQGELRAAGAVTERKPILAFGGGANMPMKISFLVENYLPSGVERDIFVPIVLPKGKKDEGIGACRVEMTVGKESKEIWLRRSLTLDPPAPSFVTFGDVVYAIAYDSDRKPLGFDLKLDDFDVGFEPGTEQATKFVSQVRLSDKSEGIKDQPHTISMNHPLYHQGYTFYQSRYQPDIDPQTERPTGRFQSIFQVAINPGRPIIYGGCLLVVLGAFVQFYMRAGLFTDGGKRERERAAAKTRAAASETLLAQGEDPLPKPEEIERL